MSDFEKYLPKTETHAGVFSNRCPGSMSGFHWYPKTWSYFYSRDEMAKQCLNCEHVKPKY